MLDIAHSLENKGTVEEGKIHQEMQDIAKKLLLFSKWKEVGQDIVLLG